MSNEDKRDLREALKEFNRVCNRIKRRYGVKFLRTLLEGAK